MRGKKLGDGGDVLLRHGGLARHDGVLFLRDIKLVKPANDLHLAAIFVGEPLTEVGKDGVLREEVTGQEQFRGVAQLFEQKWHEPVVIVAHGENQEPVGLGLRVINRHASGDK